MDSSIIIRIISGLACAVLLVSIVLRRKRTA
jgi:hypothetical protein